MAKCNQLTSLTFKGLIFLPVTKVPHYKCIIHVTFEYSAVVSDGLGAVASNPLTVSEGLHPQCGAPVSSKA